MRQPNVVTYWFCSAAALALALFGLWNVWIGKHGQPIPILIYCLLIAAVFFLGGLWVRWRTPPA